LHSKFWSIERQNLFDYFFSYEKVIGLSETYSTIQISMGQSPEIKLPLLFGYILALMVHPMGSFER